MHNLAETQVLDAQEASRDWLLTVVHTPYPQLYRKTFILSAERIPLCRKPSEDPNALVLYDPGVSQESCSLEREADGSYACADRGSRNTPRINGARLKQRRRLQANDVIRVGETLLIVELSDSARRHQGKPAVPELLRRLYMFDSTAAAILDLESGFLDPEAHCIAIQTHGFTEARVAADWLSEQQNTDLVLVDAEMDTVVETLEDPDPSLLVVVERLDVLEHATAVAVAEAIEYRACGPEPRKVAFTYADASSRSPIQRLLETAVESKLTIPALTERRSDILVGLRQLIAEIGDQSFELPPVCAEKLLCYAWPAGLGELKRIARRLHRNIVEQGKVTHQGLSAEIRAIDLSDDERPSTKLTRETFAAAYREHNGRITDVADHFGYNRGYFYRRLRKEGINLAEFREAAESAAAAQTPGDEGANANTEHPADTLEAAD